MTRKVLRLRAYILYVPLSTEDESIFALYATSNLTGAQEAERSNKRIVGRPSAPDRGNSREGNV